jgi:hypothetical protein
MSNTNKIRGCALERDLMKLATEDEEFSTEIVGFFEPDFPRSADAEGPQRGERARDRVVRRSREQPLKMSR